MKMKIEENSTVHAEDFDRIVPLIKAGCDMSRDTTSQPL